MCGYHGWHDWYLSANLGADDSLAGHLLPGLSTAGFPLLYRVLYIPSITIKLKIGSTCDHEEYWRCQNGSHANC